MNILENYIVVYAQNLECIIYCRTGLSNKLAMVQAAQLFQKTATAIQWQYL